MIRLFAGDTNLEKQKWSFNVSKELRPRKPIVFDHVLAISAKNSQLNNLSEVFKSIYKELHPRKHVFFDEELNEKNHKTVIII